MTRFSKSQKKKVYFNLKAFFYRTTQDKKRQKASTHRGIRHMNFFKELIALRNVKIFVHGGEGFIHKIYVGDDRKGKRG